MKTRSLVLVSSVAVALLACLVTSMTVLPDRARASTTVPDGFTDSTEVSGLTNPTDMEFSPRGKLFIVQDTGKISVLGPNGKLRTFLNFSERIDSRSGRGMLALTFDPDFSTNHYVYLHFTRKAVGTSAAHNRIVRVTAGNGDRFVKGSEKLVFRLGALGPVAEDPQYMGGALDFGQDHKLYVATGQYEADDNSQMLNNLFGKILRINSDGTVPTDNPFYSTASGKNRAIWALGLRNPFKFAIQPGTTNIFINDVGENTWEEINRGAAGANFGWPVAEGAAGDPAYVDPIFAYAHHGDDPATTGCAITGGTFYDPQTSLYPQDYEGDYFFADFCSGWIRTLDPTSREVSGFASGLVRPIDLEVGPDSMLYYLAKGETSTSAYVGRIGYPAN